ncbi:protein SpAN-like [Amphibalanus amphitrite]|uniref:protein SpAN-like n=1 Tax=Amphibalanus amphitrite TaxID=1232801 RepID=UPI001C909C1A|nr:protein SpAN-like [Amphibalanus amphitrite]
MFFHYFLVVILCSKSGIPSIFAAEGLQMQAKTSSSDESTSFDTISSSSTEHDTENYPEDFNDKYQSRNWTKEQLTTLLEQHGYLVKIGHGGWPLGMIGDVAYYPEELLPELGAMHERRNLLVTEKLWVNGDAETVVPFYYDTGSQADHQVFEEAVKSWADHTCIKFTKKAPNKCNVDIGEAAVCVGNFGGCFSLLGKKYGPRMRSSQQMSVQPNGCENVAAAHEFGHALGLAHEQARADREKYIYVIYENIEIDLNKLDDRSIKSLWYQGGQCSAEQMYDAPKPYDSMSLMQYGTSDFGGSDQRPVYLQRNPKFQYMFDYHRAAGYIQTHYDNYIINMGYKCIPQWKKSCEASGKSVPKCQNYGYVGKDCKCLCPKGFSGSTCGTKEGPLFPVMDRAKAMLDVTKPGLVDMKGKGMHIENHNYPKKSFTDNQYITVVIKSGEGTRIHVEVIHNHEAVKREFARSADYWIKKGLECRYAFRLYVGNNDAGKIRVECISSMMSNEPKESRPVLRSNTSELDLVGMGGWGLCYNGGPPITMKAMEFQFMVSFLERPEDRLSVKAKYPGKVGETVDKAKKAIAKQLQKNKVPIIVGVVGLVLLLIAAGGGATWWFKFREPSDEDDSKPKSKKHVSSDDDTSDSSD